MNLTSNFSFGEDVVNTPRDHAGTFEQMLVKKRQARLAVWFDGMQAGNAGNSGQATVFG